VTNEELAKIKSRYSLTFQSLSQILQTLVDTLLKPQTKVEHFSANFMFDVGQKVVLVDYSLDQLASFKELCLSRLLTDLISSGRVASTYHVFGCDFHLKDEFIRIFEEEFRANFAHPFVNLEMASSDLIALNNHSMGHIKNNRCMTMRVVDGRELKEYLENSTIEIKVQNLIEFLRLLLKHIDENREQFEQFEISVRSLDNETFYNRCLESAKGCSFILLYFLI
jgi:hypothetical protein